MGLQAVGISPKDAAFLAERALRTLGKWLVAWPAVAPSCLMQQGAASPLLEVCITYSCTRIHKLTDLSIC